MTNEIAKANTSGLLFSSEQRRMILDTFLSGASEAEAEVLLELARARKLNPITRQIHFVKRWDGAKKREVWAAQVGIDGFRTLAERTGLYEGQDEPEYEYDEAGKLALCRIRVYRKGWARPCVGVAHFSEYVQTYTDKQTNGRRPTQMWAEKPHVMLSKCAEALALRKAFPDDLSGLYTEEESEGHGIHEREVNAAPVPSQAVAERIAAISAPRPSPSPKMAAAVARVVQHLGAPDEPPPPCDDDAPPELLGEPPPSPPKRARRMVAPPAPSERAAPNMVAPYGSNKGKRPAELSDRDLEWYASAAAKAVDDPAKERYQADNLAWLEALRDEQARRTE